MDIFKELEKELIKHQNEEYALYMKNYMKDHFSFLGLKSKLRKEIASKYIKELKKKNEIDYVFIKKCYENEYREFQYVAINYLYAIKNRLTKKDIPLLKELATTKSWWDTVDGIDEIVGAIALDPTVREVIIDWSKSDNIWLRRIAIDHQLDRKANTDYKLLEEVIVNNLGTNEFFINKAIGWALREYSKTNQKWVNDFIDKYRNQMSNLSIREASKYI